MRLDKYLIGIIIFALVMTMGVLIIGNNHNNYDFEYDESRYNNASINNSGLFETTNEIREKMDVDEVEGGETGWESLIKGGYSAIQLIPNSFSLISGTLETMAEQLQLPRFVVTFAIMALIVPIAFAILYIVFKVGIG